MRVHVPALVLVAGCGFRPGAGARADAPPGSGSDGAPGSGGDATLLDAPAACATFLAHYIVPCAIPAPSAGLDLDNGLWTLSTDSGALTSPAGDTSMPTSAPISQSGGDALVVSIASLHVGAMGTLRVVGTRPLIVASWDTILIDGIVDVGSTSGGTPSAGAGADPMTCSPVAGGGGGSGGNVTNGSTGGGGSGGGGGGAFRGAGGLAGKGDTGGANPGGLGGIALAAAPTLLRGGCGGGASGMAGNNSAVKAPSSPTTTAAGGAGGGAIALVAKTQLHVTASGRVLAGGAGGFGAELNSAVGGGGGGAGGLIALDSIALAIDAGAVLAANGGAGGSSAAFSGTGFLGADAQPSAAPAVGGAQAGSGSCAGPGAAGAAGATLDGASIASSEIVSCGGGGGGGGVGFILAFSEGGPAFAPDPAAVISPAPVADPF